MINRYRSIFCLSVKFVGKRPTQLYTKSSFSTSSAISNACVAYRPVAYWLFGMSGLVAGMVTVGGITRLTRSGLSMTDWKLKGSLPPITHQEWEQEFTRYKQYPEWQQRKNMTLDEFKFIYFWEYGHRMMGRFIGIAFVVPGLYFTYKKMIPKYLYPRIMMLFGLGGTQGLIGWWMVKSGLHNIDPNQKKEIRVSPYRLATHLSMAFTTYVLLLWTAMDVMQNVEAAKDTASKLCKNGLKYTKRLRGMAIVSGVLAATTVVSGAFVAGNDAGRAYNTFPKMGDVWIPISDMLSISPIWRNFFENTAMVQFDHRILALNTLGSIALMYMKALQTTNNLYWKQLPVYTKRAFHLVAGMAVTQVGLGISTLLLYVPIPLAAVHQAGSLVLLTFITTLIHSLGFIKHVSLKLPITKSSAVLSTTLILPRIYSSISQNFQKIMK